MSESFLKTIQNHLSHRQFSELSRNISEPKIFSFNDEQSRSGRSPLRSDQNALPSKIVSELGTSGLQASG